MSVGDERQTESLRIICRVCGTINSYEGRFCDTCHLPLARGQVVTEAESLEFVARRERRNKRRRLTRRAITTVGVLALAAAIAVWALFQVRPAPVLPSPQTSVSATSTAGTWMADGFDPQNTRAVPGAPAPLAGEVKWRFQATDRFLAPPTVVDGTVYAATGDGRVVALDQETGAVRWEVTGLGPLDSAPVVAEGNIYIGLRRGTLMAMNRSNGEIRWQVETGGPIVASPAVVRGEVIVGTGDNFVHSYDAATGARRWRHPTDSWVTSAVSVDSNTAVAAGFREVYYFDTRTGTPVFTYLTVTGNSIGSPVIRDDTVYVLLHSGYVLAIDLKARGDWWERPLRRVWGQLYLWGMAPPPPSPRGLVWASRVPGGGAGMAVADDALYVGLTNGRLVAIDRHTQQELWQFRAAGFMESAPAVMGNVVYFGSDRYLYAVDAENGNELWRVELADRVSSDVVVTPNGAYIGDQAGTLYAID